LSLFITVSLSIVGLGTSKECPGGEVRFSYSTSIDDLKQAPARKNVVRGTLHYAGLWIEALGNNKCKVIYTLSSNPNGSIPTSIVNAANVSQPLCIAQVGKLIATNKPIIEKMRANKIIEQQKLEQIKENYKQKMIKQTNAANIPQTIASPIANGVDVLIDENALPPNKYDALLSRARASALAAVRSEGETDGWKFHSRAQDVDVYMREKEGSTIQECKGVGFLDASAENVDMVFNDSVFRLVSGVKQNEYAFNITTGWHLSWE
jgi:hypothetical protein